MKRLVQISLSGLWPRRVGAFDLVWSQKNLRLGEDRQACWQRTQRGALIDSMSAMKSRHRWVCQTAQPRARASWMAEQLPVHSTELHPGKDRPTGLFA